MLEKVHWRFYVFYEDFLIAGFSMKFRSIFQCDFPVAALLIEVISNFERGVSQGANRNWVAIGQPKLYRALNLATCGVYL